MPGKRKEEARRWFQQAYYDLEAAKWNFEGRFFKTACFLSQQSAEKALKSLLYYTGERKKALLTHSLVEMIREIEKKINDMTEFIEESRELDMHYILSRYPNGLPAGYPHQFYGEKLAKRSLDAAHRIFDAVKAHYRSKGEEDLVVLD